MALNYLASLSHYVPEAVMVALMMGLVLIESTYNEGDKNKHFLYNTSYIGLALTAFLLYLNMDSKPTGIFTNSVVIDPFSTFAKIIMVLGTWGAIYLSRESKDLDHNVKGEFTIIAVGVLIGGMLLSSANNMLILYIGIETLSILSYVLASLRKSDDRSSEAGLKYSLYGGISAGLMLFGMSHIFGVLGTIQFAGMGEILKALSTEQMAILIPSFLLFFVGLGYKIACVPFHMWAPDVYEGSPLPVTTFFAIVPKIAGIALLARISMIFFSADNMLSQTWIGLLTLIAGLTMTVGNVSAIKQNSVKRMLAYSSISHAGFMLMAVLVVGEIGNSAILFYGVTYLFMTLVAFYITSFIQDSYGNDHFDRFRGLLSRNPLIAGMMALTMFSLAGLPPLSGFVAKFNILSAVISKGYYTIAIVAGINSVISLYYYLKIVRYMVFSPVEGTEEKIEGFCFKNQTIILGLSVPVVFLGIFWSSIMHLISGAKIFIIQ